MNREILFKAKCITTGEWVEGDLKHGNYFEGDETVYIVKGFSNYPIDENTICQFTGLYDRHGNKIWENDIVRQFADCNELGNSLYFFYQIKWDEEYARFYGEEIYCKETVLFDELEDVEVKGNVFDNADLLGKE